MILTRKIIPFLLTLLLLLGTEPAAGESPLQFSVLNNRSGLSNGQVNAILQDSRGYVWLGTQSGLCRYDGFRIKTFFNDNLNKQSLLNNSIDGIQEDADGNLWIHTASGYCIYDGHHENFERHAEQRLEKMGIKGYVSKVFIDTDKNLWVCVAGKGCYYVAHSGKPYLFAYGRKTGLPDKDVNRITETRGTVLVAFANGTFARLDGPRKRVVEVNDDLHRQMHVTANGTYPFVDARGNYWVVAGGHTYIYKYAKGKWYNSVDACLQSDGIVWPVKGDVLVRDMAVDRRGRMWIATDHDGLLVLDYKARRCAQYLQEAAHEGALPDNTLQKVYIDPRGGVWIGTYKSGVAYYSPSFRKFTPIALGDVCTLVQDREGRLWCGTNDAGIVCYNPATGARQSYGRPQTGLTTDVVVSSTRTHDGTLYFGTFMGGMASYKDGRWKTYTAAPGQLANNSVWTLAAARLKGREVLMIGTLGGGLQTMDLETGRFTTYNSKNSQLPSDYVSALHPNKDGSKMVIGHSQNFSVMDLKTGLFTNYTATKDGRSFMSPSVNDVICDRRGIFWLATPAGVMMYAPDTQQLESINELNGTTGAVGCAVAEDCQGDVWLVTEFRVTRVHLSKNTEGKWDLRTTSFNAMDGLQDKQFNYRAALQLADGRIALGGQGGVNLIAPRTVSAPKGKAKAVFSGLVLFDHALTAGEEYDGRVVLQEPLDQRRRLTLSYKEHTFTVQLATDQVSVPSRCRFLYRMEGVSDKWLMTADGRPEVTFTNLASGSYTLQVKVVNGDGTVSDEVSELCIRVQPPFYLSWWAICLYLLLAATAFWTYRRRMIEKQRTKFERAKMEADIKRTRELNELKLQFFTNVSHELRTPLTLIISPLEKMMGEEENTIKRSKLQLIKRNADRLLQLVNQLLDFRKIEQNKGKLTLNLVDVVPLVDSICQSFRLLGNSKITLTFTSTVPKLMMALDVDKAGKIVNNLLSNAYKFTPDGGRVDVKLNVLLKDELPGASEDMLRLTVADTGKGISDKEKERVFERFYQVDGTEMQPYGGSGIGLNLVKKFACLHGGGVSVADNPGGGTVFTVDLPIPTDAADVQPLDVAPAQTELPAEEPSTGTVPTPHIAKGQTVVLLVDDSDDFREFMRDVLAERYAVVEAVNGRDALEKMQQHRPDIILSDVMMPEMDGNELCRQVKADEATRDIPFVMLTARLAEEHRKEGMDSGADDYITKPFDIDQLNQRIQRLLPGGGETAEYIMTESDRRFLDAVDTYIQEEMGNAETSVESMSSHLCMSRVQLYKRMVSLTGTTPSEYLRGKRIRRAEEMLHDVNLNISEIAYSVGFNNPRYFSKYFQEAYGVTPSQYKKNLTK